MSSLRDQLVKIGLATEKQAKTIEKQKEIEQKKQFEDKKKLWEKLEDNDN